MRERSGEQSEPAASLRCARGLGEHLRLLGVPERAYLYWVAVEPGDIDEQAHVNNAVYVRWMDRAAVAHSAALGWDWDAYRRLGAAFVVRRHEIDYLLAAMPGDEVVDATWPGELGRASAVRHHRIVRASDGRLLAKATTEWALVDLQTGRPRRLPAEIASAFEAVA